MRRIVEEGCYFMCAASVLGLLIDASTFAFHPDLWAPLLTVAAVLLLVIKVSFEVANALYMQRLVRCDLLLKKQAEEQ